MNRQYLSIEIEKDRKRREQVLIVNVDFVTKLDPSYSAMDAQLLIILLVLGMIGDHHLEDGNVISAKQLRLGSELR
jgi:hypothetical protein